MLTREDFENLITAIKSKLDETSQALVSEDLLSVLSNYTLGLDEMAKMSEKLEKLSADNEELLKVNGRLFQKIGFNREDPIEEKIEDKDEDEIKIEDVIDEKGELI